MNAPVDAETFQTETNLRGWSTLCRDVGKDSLPKTILHVCQAVYDAATPGQPNAALKLAVLDQVAKGNCDAAVEAMMPPGLEFRLEPMPDGKVMAEVWLAQSQRLVAAEGRVPASALLGCLIELSLALDPAERLKVFG